MLLRRTRSREGAGSGRQGCSLVGESPTASVARHGCVAIPQPERVIDWALRGVNGLAALKPLSFSGPATVRSLG